MSKKISLSKIREDAEKLSREGKFSCPEAVVATIRTNIAPEMPEAFIAGASGFRGGVGRSKCLCGAVAGGVLCIGYFFGRTEPAQSQSPLHLDPKTQRTLELVGNLQESFRNNHKGVLCCHVYIEGMDVAAGEHKAQCVGFTGEIAVKTASLIAGELHLEIED